MSSPQDLSPPVRGPAGSDALAMMRREMRVRFGEAPGGVGGHPVGPEEERVAGDEYLLRMPG